MSSLYFLLGILLKGMINDQHWMIRFSSFEPSLFLEEPIKLYFIVIRITNEKWICCLPLEHLMNTIFLWYRGEYYKKIYQFCKYDNISFWLFAVLPYLRIWEFFWNGCQFLLVIAMFGQPFWQNKSTVLCC